MPSPGTGLSAGQEAALVEAYQRLLKSTTPDIAQEAVYRALKFEAADPATYSYFMAGVLGRSHFDDGQRANNGHVAPREGRYDVSWNDVDESYWGSDPALLAEGQEAILTFPKDPLTYAMGWTCLYGHPRAEYERISKGQTRKRHCHGCRLGWQRRHRAKGLEGRMRTQTEREEMIRQVHYTVVEKILREKSSADLLAMPREDRDQWLKEKPARIRALIDAELLKQGIAVDWQIGLPPYLCPHRYVPIRKAKVVHA